MRQTQQFESIVRDLQFAMRTLIRTPGFSAAIIVTMAIAIGANSAIFSVIDGVLLRPLPYPQPRAPGPGVLEQSGVPRGFPSIPLT